MDAYHSFQRAATEAYLYAQTTGIDYLQVAPRLEDYFPAEFFPSASTAAVDSPFVSLPQAADYHPTGTAFAGDYYTNMQPNTENEYRANPQDFRPRPQSPPDLTSSSSYDDRSSQRHSKRNRDDFEDSDAGSNSAAYQGSPSYRNVRSRKDTGAQKAQGTSTAPPHAHPMPAAFQAAPPPPPRQDPSTVHKHLYETGQLRSHTYSYCACPYCSTMQQLHNPGLRAGETGYIYPAGYISGNFAGYSIDPSAGYTSGICVCKMGRAGCPCVDDTWPFYHGRYYTVLPHQVREMAYDHGVCTKYVLEFFQAEDQRWHAYVQEKEANLRMPPAVEEPEEGAGQVEIEETEVVLAGYFTVQWDLRYCYFKYEGNENYDDQDW